jgi:hypothetical protein
MLYKQHGNEGLRVCNYISNSGSLTTLWISPKVNSKEIVYFAKLFTLRESRRTSDPTFSRVRGSTLQRHPFRLVSEALRLLQR